MKRAIFLLFVFTATTMAVSAQAAKTIENFSLADSAGKMQSLNELKGTKGAVVVFLSVQCPVVRGYNDRINQLAADYKSKGINFIGINSNYTETADQIASHAASNYKFPVLIDKGAVIADKLAASVTPEVYFVDAKNALLYTGAVDNDRSGGNITEPYLRAAFDANLAGKAVPRASARAAGCSIKILE